MSEERATYTIHEQLAIIDHNLDEAAKGFKEIREDQKARQQERERRAYTRRQTVGRNGRYRSHGQDIEYTNATTTLDDPPPEEYIAGDPPDDPDEDDYLPESVEYTDDENIN